MICFYINFIMYLYYRVTLKGKAESLESHWLEDKVCKDIQFPISLA